MALLAPLLLLAAALPQERTAFLDPLEREAGWELSFDGLSLGGLHSPGKDYVRGGDGGWAMSQGWLHLPEGGLAGDLVTDRAFGDFELELEWRLGRRGVGGVVYRAREDPTTGAVTGPEYRLLDDRGHRDGLVGRTSTAALLGVEGPGWKDLKEAGAFNHTRIVARGNRLEHWLNGRRVLDVRLDDAAFLERLAESHFAGVEGFARGRGRIVLRDGGSELWLRSIRLRDLDHLPGERVEPFDGRTLEGWRALGHGRFAVEEGQLVTRGGDGSDGWLVHERPFGDLLLEVEVRAAALGAGGLLVRGEVGPDGRVVAGSEVVLDPAGPHTGRLRNLARGGWHASPPPDPVAREILKGGAWVPVRVECVGPSVKVWVDGLPTADAMVAGPMVGLLGFRVTGAVNTELHWRRLRVQDLGRRRWELIDLDHLEPWIERGWVDAERGLKPWDLAGERGLELTLPGAGDGTLRFVLRREQDTTRWAPRLRHLTLRTLSGWGTPSSSGLNLEQEHALIGGIEQERRRELVVSLWGDRDAVHLDGRRLGFDRRIPALVPWYFPDEPLRSRVPRHLELEHDAGIDLVSIEVLGPPE